MGDMEDMEATVVAEAMEAVEAVMAATVMARGAWMMNPRTLEMNPFNQNWSL